jgi:hypothetical protein
MAFTLMDLGGCNCGTITYLSCSPCPIPKQNLVLSWINPLFGNGSAPLIYTSAWSTGCISALNMLFTLGCNGGMIELKANYYFGSSCTSSTNYCSNLRATGFQLVLASYTCGSGFTLNFTLTTMSCPTISANGFTGFTVTI